MLLKDKYIKEVQDKMAKNVTECWTTKNTDDFFFFFLITYSLAPFGSPVNLSDFMIHCQEI
jgi:hypothetical protein